MARHMLELDVDPNDEGFHGGRIQLVGDNPQHVFLRIEPGRTSRGLTIVDSVGYFSHRADELRRFAQEILRATEPKKSARKTAKKKVRRK